MPEGAQARNRGESSSPPANDPAAAACHRQVAGKTTPFASVEAGTSAKWRDASRKPSSPTWFRRMTRVQTVWAVGGLGVLAAVIVTAQGSLTKIFDAESDFVLGGMLALTGFCFAKAFSRTGVNTALAMIREGKTSEVAEELEDELVERLHIDLALVKQSVLAAGRRTSEFYDLQSKNPLLQVILHDLDEALARVISLERAVGSPEAQSTSTLTADARSGLGDVLRDVREAVQRRNEAYEALAPQVETKPSDDLWGTFAVLTSDILKALRGLEALTAKCLIYSPDDRLAAVSGYLAAVVEGGAGACRPRRRAIACRKIAD